MFVDYSNHQLIILFLILIFILFHNFSNFGFLETPTNFKMKTSMITVIGFAMAIAASPLSAPSSAHEHKGISHSQAKEVCTFGNAACCTTFKNEEEKSLLDLDILTEPLKKLIGNDDSACMSFDLIGQVNILGTLKIFPKLWIMAEHSKLLRRTLTTSPTANRPPPAAVVMRLVLRNGIYLQQNLSNLNLTVPRYRWTLNHAGSRQLQQKLSINAESAFKWPLISERGLIVQPR